MSKSKKVLGLVFAAALVVSMGGVYVFGGADSAQAVPAVNRASGGGTIDTLSPPFPVAQRTTVAFTAQIDAAGEVKGQFQASGHVTGDEFHGQINCLSVAGNNAWLGGTITTSTNPALVGTDVLFQVRDNGQGSAAPPDERSAFIGFAPGSPILLCETQPFLSALIPWTNGNVQVR